MRNFYKTIVLSDIHIGSPDAKVKEATKFLKENHCETLILNGDIVEFSNLFHQVKWKNKHVKFFKRIFKLIQERDTNVVYVRGNHDNFLNQFIPFEIPKFKIVNELIYTSNGKNIYITHGDVFDSLKDKTSFISRFGKLGYYFLIKLNNYFNRKRLEKGLPYFSLAKVIKSKVQKATKYIAAFENQMTLIAKQKKCDAVICGHIHLPVIKCVNEVDYMNAGDWVESLTALVETYEGEWKIIDYKDTLLKENEFDNLFYQNQSAYI